MIGFSASKRQRTQKEHWQQYKAHWRENRKEGVFEQRPPGIDLKLDIARMGITT